MIDPIKLLQELVSTPGPPGQEEAVREVLIRHLGVESHTDVKGNLIVKLGKGTPNVVVTAHMDEIALLVRQVLPDGRLRVGALGGLHPWKLGEGPVAILCQGGPLFGVVSFGSIHTDSRASAAVQAKTSPLTWEMATVVTGRSANELSELGVRPGTRVVIAPHRRQLTPIGELVSGYFLDDRADLVSWILAIESLKSMEINVWFVATTSEEVGGEGALYFLQEHRPEVCIALELGPHTPDAPIVLNDQPTVWVTDAYATMMASDGDLLAELGKELGMQLQFQALSRGGSDASCAAGKGLCARPITLGLPMENTHGYEIMHPGAMTQLARLTVALVERLG